MRQALAWLWKTGILSTFLTGLFALLPIAITIGIMAWVGGSLANWIGPGSFVGRGLTQLGLRVVTDPIVAAVIGWIVVVVAIWLLGALLKSLGKNRFERTLSATIERIPLVNTLYGPVAQVVEMIQGDSTDKLQGMDVVFCGLGGEGGTGFLALLASNNVYRFNGEACQVVYVPTAPLPMSGLVIFAAVDSIRKIDMPVDDLMKICFSIGVMSSKVIPQKYVVSLDEIDEARQRADENRAT